MNKLITTLAIFLSTTLGAQLNINNDFNDWTFTNTAGLEPYGAITTTLDGGTPYLNSAVTTMTSPVYTSSGNIDIQFYLFGLIETGYDFMYFEYSTGSGWITLGGYTSAQNSSYDFYLESVVGDIQFRFALVTDGSINTYGAYLNQSLYYYDIFEWNLSNDNALPVVFDYMGADCESISWGTQSESSSSHYILETSTDGYTWLYYDRVEAQGFTNSYTDYSVVNNNTNANYFRLTQYDFDGANEVLSINSVECGGTKSIQGYYNLMGQEVSPESQGVKIILYKDGSSQKVY